MYKNVRFTAGALGWCGGWRESRPLLALVLLRSFCFSTNVMLLLLLNRVFRVLREIILQFFVEHLLPAVIAGVRVVDERNSDRRQPASELRERIALRTLVHEGTHQRRERALAADQRER